MPGLHDDDLAPPLLHDARGALPVLLSVAHAGRDYPEPLVALARHGRASLEPLEDPLVDRLAWRALSAGFGAVIARAPRAVIDCNRAEDEIDPLAMRGAAPAVASVRARAGLGLVPTRTAAHGELWRRPLRRDEVDARLDAVHRPFHRAIAERLEALALRHGEVVLIDLHSMPPRPRGAAQAQWVIGDRHATSAAPWLTALAAATGRKLGFTVALNEPFAGGHIVAAHGRPKDGVHALQVEIDRTTYCQRDCRTPGPGFERVAAGIATLATTLGEALAARDLAAAE